jgi:hypothetical protein
MQLLKQNFKGPKTCQKPYAKTPQKPTKNPLKILQPKIQQKTPKIFYDFLNKKPTKNPKQ